MLMAAGFNGVGPLSSTFAKTAAAYSADMIAWLTADLAANINAAWKVVYFHRPYYTSYYSGKPASDKNQMAAAVIQPLIEQIINNNQIDVVIQADVHAYERLGQIAYQSTFSQTAPKATKMSASATTAYNGPLYLVCGNGGQKMGTVGSYTSATYNPATVTTSMARGYCDLTFTGNTLTYAYVNTETAAPLNAFTDSFTLVKGAGTKKRSNKLKKKAI